MNDTIKGKGLLICIPTYNEKENIEDIVTAVFAQVPLANILIVDDNSPDGTGVLADNLSSKDKRIHVLHRKSKEGLGKAYLSAFQWALNAEYNYIAEFDADFSHDPKYLPLMLLSMNEADVVIGSRRIKGGGVEDWGIHRRILSWGGSLYSRLILGVSIMDLTGGLNLFKRKVLEAIDYQSILSNGYAFQIEIKYRCVKKGFKIKEVPIVFPDRVRGTSKMSTNIMKEAMTQVFKMRFGKQNWN